MTASDVDGDFTACDTPMLNRFFTEYLKSHSQGGTNTLQRNLAHLFEWLDQEYNHPSPYTDRLHRYAPAKKRPATLAEEFIRDLLELTGGGRARDFEDIRDHAIIRVFTEGPRRTEVTQMEVDAGAAARGSRQPLGRGVSGGPGRTCLPSVPSPQVPSLLLVETAPDAEFVGRGRVLEALAADGAGAADPSGFRRGRAVGREELLGIHADAEPMAVPIAQREGSLTGPRDRAPPGALAACADFNAHAGSLRESRDGGALSLGQPGSRWWRARAEISCRNCDYLNWG
jgi:hypothetical protein